MLYSFYLYYRHYCVYHEAFNHGRVAKDLRGDQKLISGLLFSMKSFCQKINPKDLGPNALGNPFRSYSTPEYKLHYFESLSGYKLLFMTDPSVPLLRELLSFIYGSLVVEQIIKNPTFDIGERLTGHPLAPAFSKALNDCVQATPFFASLPQ
ncbi:unnamed protein product [Vitrella brassicaformis CCMP3155]|uniref:Trafficking protein particle complex subunit n=1 Tax=Vitrella brassicaformis (strain CCMP3155) TaxID=1169540 RepID=A0A0G4ELJ7_VITBC|nr:unnamed protein product [Vitrella brassicaformis CCMP3155]|mmetsp:Transcript_21494/g.52640  ORF Transcript_21494/g.52640 Transcript_21494/m.52640 type:complete len:152 (+) Transcript_21494:85-540(+)|eukprot:CEL97884.1 unnamed protein product [Vitrella brassicaformis CCMP3155]